MTELSQEQLEAAAAAYERRLVPALFEPWAQRVAEAAALAPGERVLDVACGTGVLARAAAARVGPGGSVAAVDLNPGMLAVAARQAPQVDWRRAAAESLPFDDGSFDAVVSQFGLTFFEDRPAAVREMLRVLAPGGRLAVAVFDSPAGNPAYAAMADVFAQEVGHEVGDALRFPFSLSDPGELAATFEAAGAPSPTLETRQAEARFPSVRAMVLADVEGWFPLAGIRLDEPTIEAIVGHARRSLDPYRTPEGEVVFPTRAHVVTVELEAA